MVHSEKLEETVLWRVYQGKVSPNEKRSSWVKEVYEAAATYMMDVRQTFQNYTLHDETHILNVLDAMGGLLGDRIDQLTVGEIELLVLAACLHDLGMVYTEDEKQRCFQDEEACRKFLREYCPELLGCPAEEWTEDIQRWYLRTLHPFRLPGVLQNKTWKELFDRCPLEVVPKRCMIAVCQAHGENPAELLHNKDLDYLSANNADPLFCALLLRLGDLLDFDDTRAPRILYSYVACNDKSRAEWDKHQASAGFRYPASPLLNGYYTLKNQAKHHQADEPLPAPSSYGAGVLGNVERDGYRAKPGTSIAIRFEAGMLGALNLHDAIEKYLCGSRVPVYYNNDE